MRLPEWDYWPKTGFSMVAWVLSVFRWNGFQRCWVRLAFLLAMSIGATVGATESVQTLSQAQVTTLIQGVSNDRDVSLPYAWDKENNGLAGHASFTLEFPAHTAANEPWALFTLKIGNAYEIWLNGALLQRQGRLYTPNREDFTQVPRLVTIPPGLLRATNQLRVDVRADIGRKAGLTPLMVGPQSLLQPIYDQSYLQRGLSSMLVSMFSFLMGAFALVLWLTQPDYVPEQGLQRNRLYLYAALAELVWAFGVGYMFLEDPPLPWPLWGVIAVAAGVAWRCCMVLFCLEVAGWGRRPGLQWFRYWLMGLIFGMPCAVASSQWLAWPLLLTLGYVAEGLTMVAFAGYFLFQSFKHNVPALQVLSVVFLLNVAMGFRDLYVFRVAPDYTAITWLRFSSVLFGMTLGVIVLSRFRESTAHARELAQTLADRVAQKEEELSQMWAHSERLVRQQERTMERTSILRDMHDGVGSHISSAIRQLQSGHSNTDEVLLTLRDSLDQLKLSIDSMNQPAGDVTALLANLRYRLEPRLRAMGIELHWAVEHLPLLVRLDNAAMRQLQFIFFEVLSNVMQHAQASAVRIEASAALTTAVCICIEDNGRGFDVQAVQYRGLASLRQRVLALGGELTLHSAPGSTAVQIMLA
jgi:signal transduction histidine kinase